MRMARTRCGVDAWFLEEMMSKSAMGSNLISHRAPANIGLSPGGIPLQPAAKLLELLAVLLWWSGAGARAWSCQWLCACRGRLQQFFRGSEPGPAAQRRGQIDLVPFGMERRFLELLEPFEEIFHEAGDAGIPGGLGRPIIDRQNLGHPDRFHVFARPQQVGIVLRRKFGRNVIILQ